MAAVVSRPAWQMLVLLLARYVSNLINGHYLHTLLYGISDWQLCRLQSVQNAAARLVTGARRRDHITPVLRQLHWLPISQRVVFKIAGLVHQSLGGSAPATLAHDCHLLSYVGRRPLHFNSNDMLKLLMPRTYNKLGDRSFSAASPSLAVERSYDLCAFASSDSTALYKCCYYYYYSIRTTAAGTVLWFHQSLKTYLFGDCST